LGGRREGEGGGRTKSLPENEVEETIISILRYSSAQGNKSFGARKDVGQGGREENMGREQRLPIGGIMAWTRGLTTIDSKTARQDAAIFGRKKISSEGRGNYQQGSEGGASNRGL